jgi:hypothetical protein
MTPAILRIATEFRHDTLILKLPVEERAKGTEFTLVLVLHR